MANCYKYILFSANVTEKTKDMEKISFRAKTDVAEIVCISFFELLFIVILIITRSWPFFILATLIMILKVFAIVFRSYIISENALYVKEYWTTPIKTVNITDITSVEQPYLYIRIHFKKGNSGISALSNSSNQQTRIFRNSKEAQFQHPCQINHHS